MDRGERDRTWEKLSEEVETALATDAVRKSAAYIDDLTGEMRHFVSGDPERPADRKYWFRYEIEGGDFVSKQGDEVYQRVTDEQFHQRLSRE
jgi:hypothetical protein